MQQAFSRWLIPGVAVLAALALPWTLVEMARADTRRFFETDSAQVAPAGRPSLTHVEFNAKHGVMLGFSFYDEKQGQGSIADVYWCLRPWRDMGYWE